MASSGLFKDCGQPPSYLNPGLGVDQKGDDGGDEDGEEASEVMHVCFEERSMVHKQLYFYKIGKTTLDTCIFNSTDTTCGGSTILM